MIRIYQVSSNLKFLTQMLDPIAGSTANVGIQIYGEEAYSSACHLCKEGAFQRSGEDMFLIATESSLGPLWKVKDSHFTDFTGFIMVCSNVMKLCIPKFGPKLLIHY